MGRSKIEKQEKAKRTTERKKMLAFAKKIAGQISKKYPKYHDRNRLMFLVAKIMDVELFIDDCL